MSRGPSGPRHSILIPTAVGVFAAHFTARGLAGLDFPNFPIGSGSISPPSSIPSGLPELALWQDLATAALEAVLAGREPAALPPLDWQGATPFQQEVWQALLRIPAGHTCTYAQVAWSAGRPEAARAAGRACGANPIPVLVPCHRVVAAGGRLGGFSGGLDWKQRLLAREGHYLAL